MAEASTQRRRILFCAESITLSQVVRLVVLARSLDPVRYDVHFASGAFPDACFGGTDFRRHVVYTVPPAQVLRRVAWGRRPYERTTLRRYVADELALLDRVRPDLVVGDFRLSLAVSAAVARVPQLTLINAYWSPFAVRDHWPVPDHPLVALLGARTVARHFETALPWMLRYFAAPLNEVRREYGLSPIGGLLEMLTAGDQTLYADVPALVPAGDLPAGHVYLGPVLWSPAVAMPEWFRAAPAGPPWVYVTMGSSGDVRVLPTVLAALSALPVRVMLATADRRIPPIPGKLHAAPLLPGDQAAACSAFVVCNGGSSTGYQALACGTPVLGVPANLDQHLAMAAIERRGAGIGVRAQGASIETIRAAATRLLENDGHRRAAAGVARDFRDYDAPSRFLRVVERALAVHAVPRRIPAIP